MNPDQVLQALATAFDTPDLRFDANGCARLRVDDRIDVNFERSSGHLLHVYCPLGQLPADHREPIYERLLTANLFGAETGGASLAIDPEFGEIVLCTDVGNHGWTAELIASRIDRFVDAALAWQERFTELAAMPGDAAAQASFQRPVEFVEHA
ncbi:type III secretion system chaperone [Hydrogenophaga crocea]|uniref:Type III secretion system chaperone n=1 Tax=Hydrogenophaga crocea TaxID=2716225 RepID=A0A6G8IH68_9BURK|nr:type III secretion system chaperone [Hydrogenophaga crocea]QIM52547.1 type III secretion system chaperone [Hydrogenophaga crocea]